MAHGRRRILGPITDTPVGKGPRRLAVTGIIKSQKRPPVASGPSLKMHGFGALHIGFKPAQENDCRANPLAVVIGELTTLSGVKITMCCHVILLFVVQKQHQAVFYKRLSPYSLFDPDDYRSDFQVTRYDRYW
jgi:hypothetical protein